MSRRSLVSLGLAFAGLCALLIGERVVGEGWGRNLADLLGVVALLAAPAWRLAGDELRGEAAPGARLVLLLAYLSLLLGPLVYALTESSVRAAAPGLLGEHGALGSDSVQAALGVAWPACLVIAVTSLAFLEAALSTLRSLDLGGRRRLNRALASGLSLAFAVVFVVSLDYSASARGSQWDLSYRKTTVPSQGTLRMAAAVTEDTRIVLFYPRVNPVLGRIEPYFRRVAASSPHLTLQIVDHALAPELARRHRIQGNGYVAVIRGDGDSAQGENFEVGLELDTARGHLRTLDGSFQQTFSRLLHRRRELSFTTGHSEHTAAGQPGDEVGARTGELTAALRRSNLAVGHLGMAQGLAHDVPADTPAVVVLGPRSPFLPDEVDSLLRYVHGGGRLVVFVDPDADSGLRPLLAGLGLTLSEGVLCSASEHLQRTHTKADRALTYTSLYSAHPTVTLVNRHQSELATVFVGAGDLEQSAETPDGVRGTFPMHFGPHVWLDVDGDFEQGEREVEVEARPMAAVTVANAGGEEGRAVVIADGDFTNDDVIRNPGNGLVLSDVMQWMLGEEQVVADTSSEEDVPIEHTSREDAVWFYATSFGLPLPILAFGIWVAVGRRRRPQKEPKPSEKGEDPPTPTEEPEPDGSDPDESDDEAADADDDEQESP